MDPLLMSTSVGSPVSVPYQGANPSQAVHEAFYDKLDLSCHPTLSGVATTSMGPPQLSQASTNEQQMLLHASGRMQDDEYGNNAGFTQPYSWSPYHPQLRLDTNMAVPAVNAGQGKPAFALEPVRPPTHESSIKCEMCPTSFKGKSGKQNLDPHVRSKHLNEPTTVFVCLVKKSDGSDCNTKFGTWYNMTRHWRVVYKTATGSNPSRCKMDRTSFKHLYKEVLGSPLMDKEDDFDILEWLENWRISDLYLSLLNVTES